MWCTSAPSVTPRKASYKLKQVFLCRRLFVVVYCKCGFDIRVVLCTSVPSLIVRNANTTSINKFYCLRLFVVVYKLVIVALTFV